MVCVLSICDIPYPPYTNFSRGSCITFIDTEGSELDTQLDIAVNLDYLDRIKRDELDVLLVRIDKMLYSLIRSLRESVKA